MQKYDTRSLTNSDLTNGVLLISAEVVLDGVMVVVLAIGPMVRGLKPGRQRLIFKGDKIP
jgi:hypothetical protein